jgi:hypothetical protein
MCRISHSFEERLRHRLMTDDDAKHPDRHCDPDSHSNAFSKVPKAENSTSGCGFSGRTDGTGIAQRSSTPGHRIGESPQVQKMRARSAGRAAVERRT